MSDASHKHQQKIWEQEHSHPHLFPHLAKDEVSGGVERFYSWLKEHKTNDAQQTGLEIGCGKGRNSIWLADQNIQMTGFDFSESAILEAKKRIFDTNTGNPHFIVHDAIDVWPFDDNHFDFILDCFALIDIDVNLEEVFAEIQRVLKPGGYFCMYTNSEKTQMYQMLAQNNDDTTYHYPDNNKFERIFTRETLKHFNSHFEEMVYETYDRSAEYSGELYIWNHMWVIYKKII